MKRGLLTSILLLTITGLQAQNAARPRLVVSLCIDQLRTDYVEAFAPLYGSQGFKRLAAEGRVYSQVSFSFNTPDRASAVAAIYSGTTPSVNGITAAQWMDVEAGRVTSCVDDPDFMGNYTGESSSPQQLLVSTLPDELKVATRGQALVYSIAPMRDAAILSAGHAANCAFWLNQSTGKWCSTTFYKDFPWWLNRYNEQQGTDSRVRSMVWTPAFPASSYRFLSGTRTEAFRHDIDDDRLNAFRQLVTTPFINDEVNRLADELISKNAIGQDEATDFVALTYFGGNYGHRSTQQCAMEVQDMYVRLDRSIGDLLAMLDKYVGLEHTMLVLTSTGCTEPEVDDLSLYNIPGGEFHLNRCATLLNMYLMATYGEGQYVQSYYDRQIYLNHKLIEDKKLDMDVVRDKSAEFLAEFSGVGEVYDARRLLTSTSNERENRARNGYHRKRSGDLMIEVLPGWSIVDEQTGAKHTVNNSQVPSPFIIFAPGVKAETISTPVRAEYIAPTVAAAIHIRAPNGCTNQSLGL